MWDRGPAEGTGGEGSRSPSSQVAKKPQRMKQVRNPSKKEAKMRPKVGLPQWAGQASPHQLEVTPNWRKRTNPLKAPKAVSIKSLRMVHKSVVILVSKNKPKEYPNSNNMMGRFLRTGFVWLRDVNNSRNRDPRRKLRDKCKAQLAEPSTELFYEATFTRKTAGDPKTNVQNELFGEHSKRTFLEAKAICCKKTNNTNVSFGPKTFSMAEDPKLAMLGKNANKN